MREIFKIMLVTGVFVTGLVAQEQGGSIATIVPANPTVGETLTVTYNPAAREAAIKRPSGLTLQILILPEVGSGPTLVETPMKKSGEVWKTGFPLKDKNARFLLFRFVSGDLIDENVDRGWAALVVGRDGKSLEGGLYWRGAVAAFGGYMGFKHAKDVEAAKAAIQEERRLYPMDQFALNLEWYLLTNPMPTDAAKEKVKGELASALNTFRRTEEALPMLLVWLEQTGQTSEADSLRLVYIHENPHGSVASALRAREISRERDQAKRASLLEQYIRDFPMKPQELLGNQKQLATAYAESGQLDKAHAVLASARGIDPALYNSIATPLLEKGKEVEKAVKWLGEGIGILKQDRTKPAASTVADWEKKRKSSLASLLSSRGQAHQKLRQYGPAVADFLDAYALTEGEDLSLDANLIEAYNSSGKFREAEKVGLECIAAGHSNVSIVERLRTAFMKVHGSFKTYEASVLDARKKRQGSLLRKASNIAAPAFVLKGLDGSIVKLSDLRGRVVVVEVMASWSSRSRESLLQVQKSYEQYQYYRTVSFLALDSYEGISGVARETTVKQIMKDAPSTIPVVLDEGSSVADQLGVEGIPMRFVIDQFGKIRFKSAGVGSGKNLPAELSEEIEALLNQ